MLYDFAVLKWLTWIENDSLINWNWRWVISSPCALCDWSINKFIFCSSIERKKGEKLVFIPTRWFRLKKLVFSSEKNSAHFKICTLFPSAHFSQLHTFLKCILFKISSEMGNLWFFKMGRVFMWQKWHFICHKVTNVVTKTYEIVSFGHLIGQIENFNLLLLKFTARTFYR